MRPLLIVLLLALPALAQDSPPDPFLQESPLSEETLAALDFALSSQLLTRDDLAFKKDFVNDPYRLSTVQRTLVDPLATYDITWDYAKTLDTNTAVDLLEQHEWILAQLDSPILTWSIGPLPVAHQALWPANTDWSALMAGADSLVSEAPEPLEGPPGYKNYPVYAMSEWDRLRQLDDAKALPNYYMASLRLASRLTENTEDFDDDWSTVTFIHGTLGPDTFEVAPNTVILDPGGDDIYHFLDPPSEPTALLHCILDEGGDDRYLGQGYGAAGGGYFGTAIVVDKVGDDYYHTGNISQGAGLFGVGILIDEDGADTYIGGDFTQGAGMYGFGIAWDGGAGNDSYRATLYGQGAALTGGLGICVNRAGDETYYAGGAHADFPRWPEHSLSLSQGCAFGQRPDASGGIAFLGDYGGNDIYTCEVFGQGVGYWYALGMLFDREGHDWYQLHQYGQGSGIHLATGCLIDVSGIDRYNSWALAQGTGHDRGVGAWLDMEGHDFMLGNDICQGIGHFNSVGLAIDLEGDDFWGGRTLSNNQGFVNPLRDYGGIGVLLDLKGQDNYSIPGHADGLLWTEPNGGIGYDADSPPDIVPLQWLRAERTKGDPQ